MAVTPLSQEPAPTVGAEVRTAAQVLAAVLGLAGYVYLIGGVVSWVRFGAARLPGDVATAALSNRQLFEVGFRSLLVMAAVFAVMCAVAYLAAAPRWSANAPDWHEVISRGGVAAARARVANPDEREAWRARRERAVHCDRARHAEAATRAAKAVKLTRLARRAEQTRRDAVSAAEARKREAEQRPEVWCAHLGDTPVRIIAGFNTLVVSGVGGLLAARFIEFLFPHAWWAILAAGIVMFVVVHWAVSRWGPLRWPAWAHHVAWVVVVLVALFVTAPLGLLLIAGIAVSWLGRPLARTRRPQSLADLLRSPLPWALFTFYALVGLAFAATPPVSLTRLAIATPSRTIVGGYLSRSDGGVYVATCTPLADATSTNERVVFVDASRITTTTVGGELRLDSGQRPSIAALATQALGIGAHPPTWFKADLRARRAACSGVPLAGAATGATALTLGPDVLLAPTGSAIPGGRAHDGEAPIPQTTPPAVARLALRYQPTIETTVADRFWPVSVGAVLHDRNPATGGRTALCRVSAPAPPVCSTVMSLAQLSPANGTTADYLRYPAALGNNPDSQFRAFEAGQSIDVGSTHNWLADPALLDPWYTAQVYFYYAGPIRSSAWPARPVDPGIPTGLLGLEYWFFYPYNYYPTVVGSSLMGSAPVAGDETNTDLHQGDWEHVTVLLEPHTLVPQYLYMARHADEGRFLPWNSPTLRFDGTHPVIQAAFGGHPTYDNHCGPRLRARLKNASSDWLICASGRFAFRAASTPLVDLARANWACWKGHFGEAKPGLEVNRTGEADTVITKARTFVFVAGPISPLWQAENGSLAAGTGPCTQPGGPQGIERTASDTLISNRR